MLAADFAVSLREFRLELELRTTAGCLALVGPSGAGKSTALRTVAGLQRPDRGRVALAGDVWFDSERGINLAPERRRCGYVFQEYALFPHMSAWRNVAFALTGRRPAERKREALKLLDRFGVGALADAPPAGLSGGERQRVALARALAREPAVLLLDEPLAALDSRTAAGAARELSVLIQASAIPTILVTHDFTEAALLADQIAVVDRGRIVQQGTAGDLSARPGSAFVAGFAGAAVLFGTARPGAGSTTLVDLDGGGVAMSTDAARGPVGIAFYPWEVTLGPPGEAATDSALNRLEVRVTSVTEIGNRARIGLLASQPLTAEVTVESVARLGLVPGSLAVASWKATATRLVER